MHFQCLLYLLARSLHLVKTKIIEVIVEDFSGVLVLFCINVIQLPPECEILRSVTDYLLGVA